MNNRKKQQKAARLKKNLKRFNNLRIKRDRLSILLQIAIKTELKLLYGYQGNPLREQSQWDAYIKASDLTCGISRKLDFFDHKYQNFKLVTS